MPRKVVQKAQTKPKKPRKPTLAKLKQKLWTVFSEFVRLNHSDENGYCECITCGIRGYWKGEMQAGHFISKKFNPALIFDEGNVFPQCPKDNLNQGEQYMYGVFILKKYGENELNRLIALRGVPFKFTEDWVLEKTHYYKEKVAELKKQKNLK